MKNYDKRMAELNKEKENVERLIDKEAKTTMTYTVGFVNGKIKQLNELRNEAIEEVKKLQKEAMNYPYVQKKDEENTVGYIQLKAVIDHLKDYWNISEEELK